MTIVRKRFLTIAAAQFAALSAPVSLAAAPRSIRIANGRFMLDEKPFQFISGSMHYTRVPHQYWEHRLRMARAMGLNTICTYVFWNVHEPQPGAFDFSGQNDVAAFVRTAQRLGLHVILRPGPYACAEWEFGGYPAWLLQDPQTVCRTRDPRFMQPARRWIHRLGQELAALQWPRGGPVLAVQIENEYGSFGDDHAYMHEILDAVTDAGFQDVIHYTDDGIPELPAGSLPALPVAGSIGDPQSDFAALARFRPGNPVMAGEYYPGWFDHWGEPHHVTDAAAQVRGVEWMLAHGSFNLYMFHGGTNWFMNGANYGGDAPYQPTVTSYDYDAPLDETGRPRSKFFLIRKAIARHTGTQPAPMPRAPELIGIPEFTLTESAPMHGLFGAPQHSERVRNMEAYGQNYGYILYRTRIPRATQAALALDELRDYAVVLIDGTRAGTLDRRLGERSLQIEAKSGALLDILVENTGRLNYGKQFVYDRKGITKSATLGGVELLGWDVYTLPMSELSALRFGGEPADAPAFYRGYFSLGRVADTFLDVRMLGKGLLWVNGHPVGRFWEIGPQFALYVPAPFLTIGRNEVMVFDLLDRTVRRLSGRTEPLYAPIAE